MYIVNDDRSIYVTRGDAMAFSVSAEDEGEAYVFQPGDVVRIKVYGRKDAETVVLQKDFPVYEASETVDILLTEEDTKIGGVISKPVDYWYEVELNPFTYPQTIIGYDEDGAKVFKLFPEGRDLEEYEYTEEDIPFMDRELDAASTRPVENQAIARAVLKLNGSIVKTEKNLSATYDYATSVDKKLSVEKARIDNLIAGAYYDPDAELADIRVGVDGITYGSAGTAVREQLSHAFAETNALKNVIDVDFRTGTINAGVDAEHANRARFIDTIKACMTVVTMPINNDYLYGYTMYDEYGNYDGVDHGWNAMDGSTLLIDNGYFKMNFRKVVDGAFTDEDIATLKDIVTVTQFTIPEDIKELKEHMSEGLETRLPYSIELGSLTNGEKVDFTTRARFAQKVKVNKKTTVTFVQNDTFMYGYCFYDESGAFDGVDHGWNIIENKPTVSFDNKGYVMFNFRRTDAGEITDADLTALSEMLNITTQRSVLDLDDDVKDLEEKVAGSAAVNSITVEFGRTQGASYVFARIPKTTNEGSKLRPKVHLTSVDGSIDGEKVSALTFASKKKPVFTINGGLFNTNTLQPVGQTIIDGVSYVNQPMTDDMGSPISKAECYPLCIDADGNLSAPYSRNVDTADMIADGVVYAVTGWGKVIDNFKPCADTVENEIVHAETYIRQVIGQFQNGDFFVCTVDKSRNHVQNEAGLTYADLAELLADKGVKFAYSLDGGGSAETVIGQRQLNPIYEGTTGRSVPTVITFEC